LCRLLGVGISIPPQKKKKTLRTILCTLFPDYNILVPKHA